MNRGGMTGHKVPRQVIEPPSVRGIHIWLELATQWTEPHIWPCCSVCFCCFIIIISKMGLSWTIKWRSSHSCPCDEGTDCHLQWEVTMDNGRGETKAIRVGCKTITFDIASIAATEQNNCCWPRASSILSASKSELQSKSNSGCSSFLYGHLLTLMIINLIHRKHVVWQTQIRNLIYSPFSSIKHQLQFCLLRSRILLRISFSTKWSN